MSGSKARSTFRRNMAAVILKKMVRNQRSMMPLSGTSEVREARGKFCPPGNGNGQTRRSAGLYRLAASGVAGAQGLYDL